jgi:peptidyl-prolyl cis-trans isomerase-like 2
MATDPAPLTDAQMPKARSKDRLYLSATEWKEDGGGFKKEGEKSQFEHQPFYYCAIALKPAENPVCAPDGTVFDFVYVMGLYCVWQRIS